MLSIRSRRFSSGSARSPGAPPTPTPSLPAAGATLTGRVVDEAGRPLPGASVVLLDDASGGQRYGAAAGDGSGHHAPRTGAQSDAEQDAKLGEAIASESIPLEEGLRQRVALLEGLDGAAELSGAGAAYCLARALADGEDVVVTATRARARLTPITFSNLSAEELERLPGVGHKTASVVMSQAFDEPAFRDLIEWHVSEGSDGFVPCGTTGESPTLSHAEHKRVVEVCIEAAAGRLPVIAGTGSNSTDEAIELTQHAREAGADAALVVTPYYNKPTQAGLYAHYRAIHDAVPLPIIIYNIPGRSVIDMSVETMARLAELPNVIGVKDATQDLTRPIEMRIAAGPKFCQLSGEDGTALPFLGAGGHGCISVTANVAPALCAAMQWAWGDGNVGEAIRLTDRLMPLHKALFCETSPAPVKYAASLLGRCRPDVRLPLVEISETSKGRVRDAMVHAGILN